MNSLVDFLWIIIILWYYDTVTVYLFHFTSFDFFPGSSFIQDCKKEIRKNTQKCQAIRQLAYSILENETRKH